MQIGICYWLTHGMNVKKSSYVLQTFQHNCGIGLGVRTTRQFKKGEYICAYGGTVTSDRQGQQADAAHETGFRAYYKVRQYDRLRRGFEVKTVW